VQGAGLDGIADALKTIAGRHSSSASGQEDAPPGPRIPTWHVLRRSLLDHGERMGDAELEACLEALTGRSDGSLREMDDVDAETWAHSILGFVDRLSSTDTSGTAPAT